jgi:hypothetical protein
MITYARHTWIPWRFDSVPKGYWNDIKNQRSYIEWLGKEMGVTDLSDWYKIKHVDLENKPGTVQEIILEIV